MVDPRITLSEEQGVRYLHFGTEWVQGAMRLDAPYALELEYQQQMMALAALQPAPRDVLVLGLGAGAIAKFCWKQLPSARITVAELSRAVVTAARTWFALPAESARFRVMVRDARRHLALPAQRESADWLLVDLYDRHARGPVLDDVDFYRSCAAALRPGGVAAFNLFGRRFGPSMMAITTAFGHSTVTLPAAAAGNRIVLGYGGADFDRVVTEMPMQARQFDRSWRLPLSAWIGAATCGNFKAERA